MKGKLFLCLIFALSLSARSFSAKNVIINSGNILVFTSDGCALVKFDYSAMEVNDYSFDEFIEEKGGDEYHDNWERWIVGAEQAFIKDFNKRTPGIKLVDSEKISFDYKITIKFKNMDTGNAAKGLLPSMSLKLKDGASKMNGTLYLKDNEGNELCRLSLVNIYGDASYQTSTRLMSLYESVSKKIRKAVSKYLKEENTTQDDISEGDEVEDVETNNDENMDVIEMDNDECETDDEADDDDDDDDEFDDDDDEADDDDDDETDDDDDDENNDNDSDE